MGIDFGAGRRIQHRNLEASERRCIRHKAAGATLPRGGADPFAGGQQMTPKRESGSDVDNLLDVVAHNDAVALEHGALTGTSPGKRRGLRGCGALAGIGPADFGDDNRFAGLKRLFPDACQLFRRLHILH